MVLQGIRYTQQSSPRFLISYDPGSAPSVHGVGSTGLSSPIHSGQLLNV